MQEEPRDFGNLHGNNQNFEAGKLNKIHKLKKGVKPKKIVQNTADFIDYKISCKEISEDNVYIFVDYNDKHFIVTLRFATYRMFTYFREKYGVDHIIKRKSVIMKEVHVTELPKNSILKRNCVLQLYN